MYQKISLGLFKILVCVQKDMITKNAIHNERHYQRLCNLSTLKIFSNPEKKSFYLLMLIYIETLYKGIAWFLIPYISSPV